MLLIERKYMGFHLAINRLYDSFAEKFKFYH